MVGLLTFLRTIESSPSIVGLALGHDLTNLGLNLNSSKKNLFQSFGGPLSDFPCRIQDLDAKVPEEYLTNATIRDKLPNIKLNKLHEDVLFYLFYNCPGEVYQVAAASELYARDWRFHKIERFWLQRAAFSAPSIEIDGTYERCQYNAFDPIQWRRVPKEMVLEFADLEGKPTVPGMIQQKQNVRQQPPPSSEQNQNIPTINTTAISSLHKTIDGSLLINGAGPPPISFVLGQLKRISRGQTLPRPEVRLILSVLHENPELCAQLDSTEQFFDFFQYEPEIAGILLAFQLMYEPTNYLSNIEILLNMNIDVSLLVAANKFIQLCEYKNIKIPNDFLVKFISICISTCENGSSNGLAIDRLGFFDVFFL
ncbi:NOT2_3_5 domain-containing protein [Meloidogyne graminicola]|uniref:NOT2_3_5 domain-containing protein n=1 Tax=Meloidogyne graminicola TaxID=189291 RepID=A0A8S9ZUC7_9BILA|nr:NOT2_3_5 domain-containing protein [Meloidogyne graminicola]